MGMEWVMVMMNSIITLVIVTHNNFTEKNGCIEDVIYSISVQKKVQTEIIVVDNRSSYYDCKCLKEIQKKYNNFILVFNDDNCISKGRNIGAKLSNGDNIIFLDDDIIFLTNQELFKMSFHFSKRIYGYSANRFWTIPNWYENNKNRVKKYIKENSLSNVPTIRKNISVNRKCDDRYLLRTFIGNLGYINRQILEDSIIWDESYSGYGYEDNDYAFRLLLNYGDFEVLSDISVLHIWHNIKESNVFEQEKNYSLFQSKLKESGYKVFHIGRALYAEGNILE